MQGGHLSRCHDLGKVVALKFAKVALRTRRIALAAIAILVATNACAWSNKLDSTAHIVLDSGHSPLQPGALGAQGLYEVSYNDSLTAKVASALKSAGFNVTLTRTPLQEITLDDRAQFANSAHADLFLAIHHDSTQLKYLEKFKVGKLDAYRTVTPMSGYSLYTSQLNPRFEQSLHFAKLLASGLHDLGRPPAMHHAEPIAGENRELLDQNLGIYRYDQLLVLRKTDIPAVLLEVGVIPDQKDEAYVSDEKNQTNITKAIVTAVQRYVSEISTVKAK